MPDPFDKLQEDIIQSKLDISQLMDGIEDNLSEI